MSDAFDQGAWDAAGSEGSDIKTDHDAGSQAGQTSDAGSRKRRSHTIDKDLQSAIAASVSTAIRAAIHTSIDKAMKKYTERLDNPRDEAA